MTEAEFIRCMAKFEVSWPFKDWGIRFSYERGHLTLFMKGTTEIVDGKFKMVGPRDGPGADILPRLTPGDTRNWSFTQERPVSISGLKTPEEAWCVLRKQLIEKMIH